MHKEDWPEYWGRVISVTVIFGILSAIAGVVWGLAVGFDIGTGAFWGGIIGGSIVLIMTLGITAPGHGEPARQGMIMMFGGFWAIAVVIGLVVWLIRTLIG